MFCFRSTFFTSLRTRRWFFSVWTFELFQKRCFSCFMERRKDVIEKQTAEVKQRSVSLVGGTCLKQRVLSLSLPLPHCCWTVLPDWAVLNLIVRVNIGLAGWTKFGLGWGQFGSFQTYKLYRLIG